MAPNSISSEAGPSGECPNSRNMKKIGGADEVQSEGQVKKYEWGFSDLKWRNIIVLTWLHIAAIYSFFDLPKVGYTYALQFLILIGAAFGVTSGAHRYFTHRSYHANKKLKYFLIFLQTLSAQEDILKWVRDHRVHHKFTDTDADPHNSKRGFFFSHVGWLFLKKHPDVKRIGSKVDMSDLENDPALLFQRKIYMFTSIMIAFILPIWISTLWGDDFYAVMNFNIFRYVLGLHVNWSINSFAHIWGMRPYDKNNSSTDSYLFGFFAFGEGWHNYHHAFPWDYKTGEYTNYFFNFSLIFIDFFAWLGWATDLKTTTPDMVKRRAIRTGDGSHPAAIEAKKKQLLNPDNNNEGERETRDLDHFWGWDDPDMLEEDKEVLILHQSHEE